MLCISMLSLSHSYELPTYLIAGTMACYVALALPTTSLSPQTINAKAMGVLLLSSIGFMVFTHLYIKLLLRMG